MGRRVSSLGGWAIAVAGLMPALCFGQATSNAQTFALSDTKDLVLLNVKADAIEYQGRQAVRLTKETEKDGFALLRGTDFQDGAIEADIALKITTPPGVRMPGFVGIGFRARPDASRYELFYLRPGNARSDDQAMRNHSVQYVSVPDFDWYKLRRGWPWVYEAYADLQPETWTKVRIEVLGRDGSKVTGTWTGDLGNARPVAGTWRDGYVDISFDAQWKFPNLQGHGAATLAGWLDGDSASGRMKVEGLTDGRWTATRKP